jgi:hypothetical protein
MDFSKNSTYIIDTLDASLRHLAVALDWIYLALEVSNGED